MSSETITKNDLTEILNGVFAPQKCWGTLTTLSAAMTLTTTETVIPLTTFNGSKCSLSSNGIKVDEAGVYAITGSAYFSTGYTVNDLIHLRLLNGSTRLSEMVKRVYSANPYEVIHTDIIASLAAGDVVQLKAYNQIAARGQIGSNTGLGIMLHRIA